ncbi:MAG: ribonuclease H-like domain-containing protein [Phycisphaerae bacterium]
MDTRPLSREIRESIAKGDFASALEMLRRQAHSRATPRREGTAEREPLSLTEVCNGSEVTVRTPGGEVGCCSVHRGLREAAPENAGIAREYSAVLRGARQRFDDDAALGASAALCHAADADPGDLLFMRIETCGPGEAIVFLIGMMQYTDGDLVFDQCLARDCREEPAILQVFADRCAEARVLVTFNGMARDMSMVRQRSAFHDIELPRRRTPHLDLLREARRRWRGDVPNLRLETLEQRVCGRRRVGDIPGRQIPQAYERFVETGDARQIGEVLHHNMLDLLTMAQLVVAILTGCGPVVG